jgi:GTP-binding protein
MFYDETRVQLASGAGGDGSASLRRARFVPKGGPDGGDGGRGGDLLLRGNRNVGDLRAFHFQPHWKAENGQPGRGQQKNGRGGRDRVLAVPVGTEVRDEEGQLITEILRDGEEFRLLRGGKGGRGNLHFKSATNQTPREYTAGGAAEEGTFILALKTIADIGLVGFPNAGKSSLLGAWTGASPKAGAYPFTTVHPTVGMTEPLGAGDYRRLALADVPGLIQGASEGKGLGLRFLRHVERCPLLLAVLDAAGVDERDPVEDWDILLRELDEYEPPLGGRVRLAAANKTDLPGAEENLRRLREALPVPVYAVSAQTGEGLAELREALFRAWTGLRSGAEETAGSAAGLTPPPSRE